MQSYPSGHTGSAFAAGLFLALYLNAKLKAFSNYHTNFAKILAVVSPLIGALLISVGMIIGKVISATHWAPVALLIKSYHIESPHLRCPPQHPPWRLLCAARLSLSVPFSFQLP